MKRILLLFFICIHISFGQESKIEVQSAHAGHISIAKIDSKNNLLITNGGFSDKSIKIWDLHSGLMLKSLSYTTTINNIFIDETNDRIFIGDINGIEILDSNTFEITKNIPIKFLKNYVYDSVSNLIYYVSGDAEFDGINSFFILNPFTGKIVTSQAKWPSEGYPMYANLITFDTNPMIAFSTNFMETVYYDIKTKQIGIVNNSNHAGFFDNLDMLYQEIVDDTHVKIIRYNSKENKDIWTTTLDAGRTKTGFNKHFAVMAFTPDKSSLWVAPSQSKIYELDSKSGDIIGYIESNTHKTKLIADNNYVYALEPINNSIGSPANFNKYRRYSNRPLTTYGSLIFNVNDFEIYNNEDERGFVFSDLKGNIGSVSVNNSATSVVNYFTNYKQKFSLWGNFYTSTKSRSVYLGMDDNEGIKNLIIGKPSSFKHVFSPESYLNKAIVSTQSKIAVTHTNKDFSVYDIETQKVLFKGTFKDAVNVISCKTVFNHNSNEMAILVNDEVVFDEPLKRHIEYYNYKTKKLLWEKEGDFDQLFLLEKSNQLLTFNIAKQQAELLNASSGQVVSTFSIPNISYSEAITINPSEELLILSGYKSDLRVYNLKSGKLVSKTDKFDETYIASQFITDAVYVSIVNGHFRFYNVDNHKEILRLYVFLDNEWLAHTPSGQFEGSQNAWNRVIFTKGTQVIPLNQVFNNFYTPNLVFDVLKNKTFQSTQSVYNLNKAPNVSILYNDGTRNVTVNDEVTVAETTSKSKEISLQTDAFNDVIKEVRLFHNGKRINPNRNNATYTINFVEGENEITAVAVNSQNTESAPRKFIVKYKPKKEDTTAKDVQVHLMTVGIDLYKNPKYNLNYAVADALGFKTSVSNGIKPIITNVKTYDIKNKEANKTNIVSTLNTIAEESQPQDVFIFYYAGHGVMTEGETKEFYLVPHDVTQLYGNEDGLLIKGISAKELKDLSTNIRAQKQLFVLDACQSGGALTTLASRGAAEEKAIAQLARSTGTHWLTASGSQQFATEFADLGHGAFTYALLEALSGKADNGDARITVNELKAYIEIRVPELSEKFKGSPQYPSSFGFGQDFPVSLKN